MKSIALLVLFFILIAFPVVNAQVRQVEIREAGSFDKDEARYPGANILSSNKQHRVYLYHDGWNVRADRAILYKEDNFFRAYGNVKIDQGDTIFMNSEYVEYDGKTKKALAHTQVLLRNAENATLQTDTLRLDRNIQQAYYNTQGIVRDSTSVLTSERGRYFLDSQKYRFTSDVVIENPEFTLNSGWLDYYTGSGYAYMYGPSTIEGRDYTIYCERGFYNTVIGQGYFLKNSKINYDKRIIEGDSLFFDKIQQFATATNHITVTDTLNKTWLKGHYAEVYKAKDSAFVTRRAQVIYLIEKDTMYMHGDTLKITGKEGERIIRGYYGVRFYKQDLRGKCDSVHIDEKTGLTQLMKLPLKPAQENLLSDRDKTLRNPVIWSGTSQMTGDIIHLISDKETEQLDSLKLLNNAFVIEKDTLGPENYNQVKGKFLYGKFLNNELRQVDVIKNAEMIYYVYSDEPKELVGIDKILCSKLTLELTDNQIDVITYYTQPDGQIIPEKDLPKNARQLRGFAWRGDEMPMNKDDIFDEDENEPTLPIIRGLQEVMDPQLEFKREEPQLPISTEKSAPVKTTTGGPEILKIE